jgi:hypothetical protein
VALKYEHFSFKRVVVEANLWPPPSGEFADGVLSRLFGDLNDDELFTNCEIRPSGATFTGEYWTYDLNGPTVLIRCFGYRDMLSLYANFRKLLDGTRVVAPSKRVAFYAAEIRAFAEIPESGKRKIGDVVQKRLLRTGRQAAQAALPNLMGAGLSLTGATEDFGWHANIDSSPMDNNLHLFAGLTFHDPEPPRPGADLEAIEEQIKKTCSFVQDDLQAFSAKLFT